VDKVGYPNNQNIVGCGQVKTARTAKGLLVIWISNIIQGWIRLDNQITKINFGRSQVKTPNAATENGCWLFGYRKNGIFRKRHIFKKLVI
jgi:hypothetical protein